MGPYFTKKWVLIGSLSQSLGVLISFGDSAVCESQWPEAPMRAEFLQKRLISAFFGFQWQNLAEILHLFKKYNNIGKVAVKRVSWTDYAL